MLHCYPNFTGPDTTVVHEITSLSTLDFDFKSQHVCW